MSAIQKGSIRTLLVILLAWSALTSAEGVTPYLPMNMSPIFENDIEKLAVLTNIPQLTKPYNVVTVLRHMKKIRSSHPALYRRLDKAMESYSSGIALGHARLSFSSSDNDEPYPLPNQMGSTTEQTWRLKAHGHWQESTWLGVYAGIDTSNERTVPSGSVIALGTDWAQLDIGYKERWWSPFQGSAQMISTNAETLPSIGLSNNTPIELFGTTFNYDVFVAQTSRQPVIYQGEWSDKNKPFFSGMHFSIQPTEWWSIGVNRMFQFGGGERETGIKDVLRAVVDPRGADNTGDDLSQDEQTGNQIASIVNRMNFDGFSIYMEYAGEDTSNNKAWQLGNTAINTGLFFPSLLNDKVSLTYEYSEWQESWYTHSIYQENLSHNQFILGHALYQNGISSSDDIINTPGSSHYLNANFLISADQLVSVSLSSAESQLLDSATRRYQLGYTFPVWQAVAEFRVFGEELPTGDRFIGGELAIHLR